MGSGNSRLNSLERESLTIKTYSTIISRFEEFRKRRNAESTLSKKQLLKDAVEEDYCSSISQPSSHETSYEVEDHKVKDETFAEKVSSVVPMANSECEIKDDNDNVEKVNKEIDLSHNKVVDENEKVEAENKTEEENIEWLVEEVKEENDDVSAKSGEKDDTDEEIGRFLCPGSPSFRIYCIEEHKKEDQQHEEEEESKNIAIVLHHKSPSADSVSSIVSRSPRISNEVPQIVGIEPTYSKRKGNKMRKFGAVRTLLKVKSCYHPMFTCAGDERTHFVAAKAVN